MGLSYASSIVSERMSGAPGSRYERVGGGLHGHAERLPTGPTARSSLLGSLKRSCGVLGNSASSRVISPPAARKT